jgi:hypothetical protein
MQMVRNPLGGHLEDVSTKEMQRRYSALFEQ